MSKKQGNQQRRQRRRRAQEKRQERRDERLLSVLDAPEAQADLERFTELWATYHIHPRPGVFPEMVEIVKRLGLTKVPVLRYGAAAALATVYRSYPQHQEEWQKAHPELVQTVLDMYPDKDVIHKIEQLDQELMAWSIDQDQKHIDRVRLVALDPDNLFQQIAVDVLEYYSEVFLHLDPGLDLTIEDLWGERTEEVQRLERYIKDETPNGNMVLGVRWDQDKYVIHTLIDGVDGLPVVWHDVPVLQQKASKEERHLYAKYVQDSEII